MYARTAPLVLFCMENSSCHICVKTTLLRLYDNYLNYRRYLTVQPDSLISPEHKATNMSHMQIKWDKAKFNSKITQNIV